MAKPKILFQYGTLLLTLIFTLGILQFPSLQQQQYYQSATAQQHNNKKTMKQPHLQYLMIPT